MLFRAWDAFRLLLLSWMENVGIGVIQLFRPPALNYGRVVVLHLAILGGGFLAVLSGSPLWMLVLMAVLKAGLDPRAPLKERMLLPPAPSLPETFLSRTALSPRAGGPVAAAVIPWYTG